MTFGWQHLQICLHAVQCVAANKQSSDKLMPGVPFPFSPMNVWWGTSQKCGLCKSCGVSCYLRQCHHLFWLRYYTDVTTLCKIWIVVWSHSLSARMSNSDDGAWTKKARKAGNKQNVDMIFKRLTISEWCDSTPSSPLSVSASRWLLCSHQQTGCSECPSLISPNLWHITTLSKAGRWDLFIVFRL